MVVGRRIETQVAIVGGPPRDEFFAALQFRHKDNTITLTWQARPADMQPWKTPYEVCCTSYKTSAFSAEIIIDEVSAWDETGHNWGHNWLFKGRFRDGNQRISGYYSTDRHYGWIAPRDDK